MNTKKAISAIITVSFLIFPLLFANSVINSISDEKENLSNQTEYIHTKIFSTHQTFTQNINDLQDCISILTTRGVLLNSFYALILSALWSYRQILKLGI